jgi:hypothetical protein
MRWLPRCLAAAALAGLLATLVLLAQPSPPRAEANPLCDVGSGPAGVVTEGVGAITGGLVGGGNPVGDACNSVSGAVEGAITSPISSALKGVGNGIFEEITKWVSEGAGWLIAKVVSAIEETTTPQLTTKGFLAEYGQMAEIAALMGLAMLLLAVLEGLAQGNAGMLVRVVLINLPLAFVATSVAYAVVQLLLVSTDGLCHTIASASHHDSEHFFKGAIAGLGEAGGTAGKQVGEVGGTNPAGGPSGEAAGTVAVPLFVTFLAAIIGAFAAFLVWLELLMRDAAVYVVALFTPLALAASIWPRWSGALRRTGELLFTVIASKFVIVAIISLAAGLVSESDDSTEHILAAAALMLLACFAPLVLMKLVPFAEGAMSAAYNRRSSGGGLVSGMQMASDVAIMRNMARSNWSESGSGSGTTLWNASEKGVGGGSAPGGDGGGKGPGGGSSGGGGGGAAGGEAAAGGAAAGGASAAAAIPGAAIQGSQAAAERLQGTAVAKTAGESGGAEQAPPAPAVESPSQRGGGAEAGTKAPRPAPEPPSVKPEKGGRS